MKGLRPSSAKLLGCALALATLGPAATPMSAAAAPIPGDHGCLGRWVGTGQNTGFDSVWTIELTLESAPAGNRCGTVEYTNPDCGGTLETCELRGGEIHTQERYSHREEDCAPAGRVIIVCEGDTMRYSWIGWERVDSTLHRSGAPRGGSGEPPAEAPMVPSGAAGETTPPAPSPAPTNPSQRSETNRSTTAPDTAGGFDLCPLTGALSLGAGPLSWLLFGGRRRRGLGRGRFGP